jgi:hypothetical protein
MDSQAKESGLTFFVAVSLGVPGIELLGYAILDRSVTITHMWQGYAKTEKDLERLIPMQYHRGKVPPGAPGRALRGHHGHC